ncbi:unnamed protein product [Cuscuta campestris]|uniref:Ubiquitin-like protease family profile domain-containing protein n=1 Tax=Cuscuta campestris TaxID=132261 RepID=A0A484L302_9ASTE|nr:unnamed protein product [Cuscuta campestris]
MLVQLKKRPKRDAEHVDLGEEKDDGSKDADDVEKEDKDDDEVMDCAGNDAEDPEHEGDSSDSDDDFEEPPKKNISVDIPQPVNSKVAIVVKKRKDGLRKMKEKYMRIKTRSSPHVLQGVLDALNNIQKQEIEKIGFGSILRLRLTELLAKLGYWVVKNFNPRSSTLELPKHVRLHISIEDVEHVLGLPRGNIKISNKARSEKCSLVEEWRAEFGKKDNRITPLELGQKLLTYEEGGNIANIDSVVRLNWCEYVHRTLIDSAIRWEDGKIAAQEKLKKEVELMMKQVKELTNSVEIPTFEGRNDPEKFSREEVVFKKGKFWLSREDICSLDILKHISKKVLDAWCVILNLREKYRSNTSPLRLFAKKLDCVVNGGHEDNSLETTRLMFNDAMKSAWDDAEDSFNWGKPELFFFPIMQTNWCYVLCVDLKGRRCDILDSSSAKAKNEE